MSKPVSRAGITVSAALMGAGFIVFMVANAYHPSGIDPNSHQLVFAQYAQSAGWTADHLGYFVYHDLRRGRLGFPEPIGRRGHEFVWYWPDVRAWAARLLRSNSGFRRGT